MEIILGLDRTRTNKKRYTRHYNVNILCHHLDIIIAALCTERVENEYSLLQALYVYVRNWN